MKRAWLIIAIALLLSACGGKSTSNFQTQTSTPQPSDTTITARATGAYQASDYLQTYVIVLPNDMYYELAPRINADGTVGELWLLRTGQGKSENGTYTASVTQFFNGYERLSLNISAKYVPGTSLSGTRTFLNHGSTQKFEFSAVPAAVLEFKAAANLTHITGPWKAWGLCDVLVGGAEGGCEPYTVTISSTGEFKLSGWGWDCTLATLTPDSAGNFFTVKFATGEGACLATAASGSGFAAEMLMPNGTWQLLLALVNDNSGMAFVAQR